ncbi:hypothetical protein VIGAN_06166900 [Vigna angularis var. angularis]|uniref:Uncharacterized protein n=1 Tax=Vigna angularis var. angularis TaxID=157739 RepID=A0A0S3SC99_PHAAN|nr:hypothetical protein VIGAN_06166900 [Vigna angularis var. angularis]
MFILNGSTKIEPNLTTERSYGSAFTSTSSRASSSNSSPSAHIHRMIIATGKDDRTDNIDKTGNRVSLCNLINSVKHIFHINLIYINKLIMKSSNHTFPTKIIHQSMQ